MRSATAPDLLAAGTAFIDLSSWRKIAVSGDDAPDWLNDLVSADISGLAPGGARRSLLLSPNGRVRAEFTVARPGGDLVLLQDPVQPTSVQTLLAPYVLSSDVALVDRTAELALFAFPGRTVAPDAHGAYSAPSCTGMGGLDMVAPAEDHDAVRTSLSRAFTLAEHEALEAWRTAAGIPRFWVDATEDDLPQEAGLDDAISFDKGCYLGQEAVAKVRNLGHPRRLVLHLAADGEISPGDAVLADGVEVGEVTSATGTDGRWRLLARVRWAGRDGPFRSALGVGLVPVPRSVG
jgi:folate-binding protein YgfZ